MHRFSSVLGRKMQKEPDEVSGGASLACRGFWRQAMRRFSPVLGRKMQKTDDCGNVLGQFIFSQQKKEVTAT